MVKSGAISKGALASGVLGVGLVSGLAAASLGMTGVAAASCVNISGIAIGGNGHCQASFGSFAVVIGPTPAEGISSTAVAGDPGTSENPGTFSPLNLAIAVGSANDHGTSAVAGAPIMAVGLPNVGNVSFATAGSSAITSGLFNLAGSFGGTDSTLLAAGAGNSALNIGSDNALSSTGVVNNTTVLFGNGNTNVGASNNPVGLLGQFTPGLNVAFSILGNNNQVLSGASAGVPPDVTGGPLSIAGAIGVNDQTGPDRVRNTNFGIELRTPFNAAPATPMSVLATGNKVTPKTLAAGSVKNTGSASSGSLAKADTQVSSSLKSLSTKISGTVKKVTGGLAGGTKADAASTSHSDK